MEIIVFLSIGIAVLAVLTSIFLVRRVKKQIAEMTDALVDVKNGNGNRRIGAVLTILAASVIVPALPYLLSFAAGAMLYVVVEELIPEMSQGEHSDIGTVLFAVGFSLMMVLDVALG